MISPQFPQIRASRLASLNDLIGAKLSINGVPVNCLNLSETGLAFSSNSTEFLSGEIIELKLFLDVDRVIYEGKAQIAWVRPASNGCNVGVQFTTKILSEDLPQALESLALIENDVRSIQAECLKVPTEFKSFILDFKVYLKGLKQRLDDLEASILASSADIKQSYKLAVELHVGPSAVQEIKKYTKQLDSLAKTLTNPELRKASIALFRAELNEYLAVSPFTHRATLKPRGYAGDYEMMNQIYRDAYEGNSLYSQIIHKYSINESSSESVRYRKNYLMDWFKTLLKQKSGSLVFGNLASGPAREVVDFLKVSSNDFANRCSFILMDQDSEALLNSKRNISQVIVENGLNTKVTYAPISVRDMLEKSPVVQALNGTQFDLLYTAGLFDYLSQPLAKTLASELMKLIKPGGMLIIGNFHPNNPTKSISEFSADWRLIHRTEEQMLDLAPENLRKSTKVHADKLGIDLFLEVTKDS